MVQHGGGAIPIIDWRDVAHGLRLGFAPETRPSGERGIIEGACRRVSMACFNVPGKQLLQGTRRAFLATKAG